MTRAELLAAAKPILFNTDMVRAILDDRKSETRRVMKPQPLFKTHRKFVFVDDECPRKWEDCDDITKTYRYRQGDYLYVRETWANLNTLVCPCYYYRASDTLPEWALGKWHPSIHMPKEAARIFLRVTDIRVERLQDIEPVDVIKEGAYEDCWDCLDIYSSSGKQCCYREEDECSQCGSVMWEWEKLWNSTIPRKDLNKYGWDASPWVWVIQFERVEV